MKKIFGILVLAMSFLFTSCGGEHFEDGPELTNKTGILVEQSDENNLAGTHVLKANGESIASRSLSINLSDLKFLNNKVEALGFMNEKDQVFEISGLTVVDKLSEAENEARFVEYKNPQWGFELKYLDDWGIAPSDLEIAFLPPESEEKVTVSRDPFEYAADDDAQTLDNPLAAYFKLFGDEKRLEDISPYLNYVGIDKVSAVKIFREGEEIYYLYRPGFIYIIRYSDPAYDESNKLNFSTMLTEFRFIPIGEPVAFDNLTDDKVTTGDKMATLPSKNLVFDFASFESIPYHFKGKYPKNWYYAGASVRKDSILHHYSFSTESVNGENEILSLDVLSSDLPAGKKVNSSGKELIVKEGDGVLEVFVEVGDYVYLVSGPEKHKDLIVFMAASIEETEN